MHACVRVFYFSFLFSVLVWFSIFSSLFPYQGSIKTLPYHRVGSLKTLWKLKGVWTTHFVRKRTVNVTLWMMLTGRWPLCGHVRAKLAVWQVRKGSLWTLTSVDPDWHAIHMVWLFCVHYYCMAPDKRGIQIIFISSPEQRSRRAIVLPSASASTNVKVFIKVFKTSLFPNLITDLIHLWYDDAYWSKILHSTIPTTLGHVKVKVTDLEFSC